MCFRTNSVARIAFFTLLLFTFKISFGQNEARVWNFGFNCGLNFSVTPPTSFTNSAFSAMEGGAGISNQNGNLMFYTDGSNIYNAANAVMANGSGLFGSTSTCQSAVIERLPGSTHLYYVFTLAELGNLDGLCYSIVDMNLAAGMGSVTTKNQFVYTPSCEKMASVMHCNGTDIWILTHVYGTNAFRAYLLTAAGLSSSPVITNLGYGSIANGVETIGQLKISPQGNRLACCYYKPSTPAPLELYDFDAATGVLSNAVIVDNAPWFYGCEFSPDGSKLYASRVNCDSIFQYNLCGATSTAIAASRFAMPTSSISVGSMQLALNGKIYICRSGGTALSVIGQPNLTGPACGLSGFGASVNNNGTQTLGLPNFRTNSFRAKPGSYSYTATCNSANFSASDALVPLTLNCIGAVNAQVYCTWEFGDPTSTAANTATGTTATHNFSSIGTYTVKLLVHHACKVDTVKQQVVLSDNGLLPLLVAGNTTLCLGESRFYSGVGASTYTWSTGSTQTIVAFNPTTTTSYSLAGTSAAGCTGSKTFTLLVVPCLGTEVQAFAAVSLIENPMTGILHLRCTEAQHISLLNAQGMVCLDVQLSAGEHKIDVSALAAGYYVLVSDKQRGLPKKLIKLSNSAAGY